MLGVKDLKKADMPDLKNRKVIIVLKYLSH